MKVIHNWREFAQVMVETNELDPTYPVVKELLKTHDNNWKGRFLIHYLWFYNLKDAIRAADATDDSNFWDRCYLDAAGEYVKRGGARRHFRGRLAEVAIDMMSKKHPTAWEAVQKLHRSRYREMYSNITKHYKGCQLGPYYIWKMMDWYDICLDWDVSLTLDDAVKYMPDVPRDAAKAFMPYQDFKQVLTVMLDFVNQFPHPVKPRVQCGLSEVETILCGLNASFGKGRLAIGADIDKQYFLLSGYPELQQHLPHPILGTYELGEYRHVG